jgi:DNA-directed RNA polymerase subunit RPC12/RpoP
MARTNVSPRRARAAAGSSQSLNPKCYQRATCIRIVMLTPWFRVLGNCLSQSAGPTLHLPSTAWLPTGGRNPEAVHMLETTELRYAVEPVRCPDCRHSMVLVCTLPKFVSLPEIRKYRCVECGLNAFAARSGLSDRGEFGD